MYGTAMMGLLGGGGAGNLFAVTPYTGNGSTQSIVTGQNLAAGGLVFEKNTEFGGDGTAHDTSRGNLKRLIPNATNSEITETSQYFTSFDSNGFTLGLSSSMNRSGEECVAFSWLEQALFMDVVTYTGNAAARTIAHNLAAVPQMIIVKCRTLGVAWEVYHSANTANPETEQLKLNSNVATSDDPIWNDTLPTSSVFSLGTGDQETNAAGNTYVAYLFAEKAGKSKFGSYVGNYTGVGVFRTVSGVGFTPKAVLIKNITNSNNWVLAYNDNGTLYYVEPNTTAARTDASSQITFNSDGFEVTDTLLDSLGSTYIYAAWG